jgi:membrane protease YdiL (CAAX protease family)
VLSPRPWKLEAVLRLVIGVFLCLFAGMLLALLIRGGNEKSPTTILQVIVSAIFFQGAIIALVWRFVREHGMSWSEAFGLHNARARAITLGIIAIFLFLPLGALLQQFSINTLEYFGIKPAAQEAVEALRTAKHGVGLFVFAVVTVVIAPLGEELLFRGVLYPAVKYAGFPKLALWGTSLLFALIHFNRPIFLPLLLLALLLVWLYERTDNLAAPLAAHAMFNATNLVIFFAYGDSVAKLPTPQ